MIRFLNFGIDLVFLDFFPPSIEIILSQQRNCFRSKYEYEIWDWIEFRMPKANIYFRDFNPKFISLKFIIIFYYFENLLFVSYFHLCPIQTFGQRTHCWDYWRSKGLGILFHFVFFSFSIIDLENIRQSFLSDSILRNPKVIDDDVEWV